jgi:[acyl-carrier-protein] S-malonyltransferase
MSKTAFIFPGQGSQFVGMGTALAESYPEARYVFDEAASVLGPDLIAAIENGPKSVLNDTRWAQPALLTASIAAYVCLIERGLRPDAVAGHSLGEYSALVAADAFDLTTGLEMVQRRGRLMGAAAEMCDGSMMAVMGLSLDALRAVLDEVHDAGIVEIANLNCPGQIVISGEVRALEAARRAAEKAGAKRVIELKVSGPFHSSLMKSAAEMFEDHLKQSKISVPQVAFVPNVTGRATSDPEEIEFLLGMQIYRSVLWEDSVRHLIELGCDRFIEVGPGKVLGGLMRRIDRSVDVISVGDPDGIEKAVAACKAADKGGAHRSES